MTTNLEVLSAIEPQIETTEISKSKVPGRFEETAASRKVLEKNKFFGGSASVLEIENIKPEVNFSSAPESTISSRVQDILESKKVLAANKTFGGTI